MIGVFCAPTSNETSKFHLDVSLRF